MSAFPIMPKGVDSPSRYEPNPVDDRKLSGEPSSRYLAIATAIESVTDALKEMPGGSGVKPSASDLKVRTALNTALGAMRRAAFLTALNDADKA